MFTSTFRKQKKQVDISLMGSLILIVLFSLGITGFLFYIAPGSLIAFLKSLLANPMLFFLNYIPILLLMLLIYLLSGNAVFSVTTVSSLLVILGIANRLKIQMRQDPLLPTDLTLIREVLSILQSFQPIFLILIALLLIVCVLAIICSWLFFRGYTLPFQHRVVGSTLILILALVCNTMFYAKESLYNSFPVEGNIYFQVNQYNAKGFLYSFLHQFNTRKIQKPIGYLSSTYDKLEETPPAETPTGQKPHIVMVMGEAFSDLSINENIDFTGYIDPLANFKELAQDSSTISGKLVVPNFGGGTSDTEYDVLTACTLAYYLNSLRNSIMRETWRPPLLKCSSESDG